MVRAEIDTGAPFRSVKDAVTLFGERILLGDNFMKSEERNKEDNGVNSVLLKSKSIEAELLETKESLKKAEEENKVLSQLLETLTQELETTKEKLTRSLRKFPEHPQVEDDDVKFTVNEPADNITEIKMNRFDQNEVYGDDYDDRLERRRSVKFANPPLLTKVIVSKEEEKKNQVLVKKTKKMKPLVPLAAWLFSKNRSS